MIEKHYLDLLNQEGFIQRYFDFLPIYETCKEAYEAVERQHELAFGKRKYGEYAYFASVLSRWNKKK